MNSEQQQQKSAPSTQEKKDGNLDPISKAPGAHPVGTAVGATAGGVAGIAAGVAASAATGLATGTVLGGPVGAAVGLVAGAVIGGLAGKAAGEAIDPTREDAYWREQYRNEPYYKPGEKYEAYGAAYRTGYQGVGRHAGKSFDEAEADLRMDYESQDDRSDLEWDRAQQASRAAWNRVSGQSSPHRGM